MAPTPRLHPTAVIGDPPEHRDFNPNRHTAKPPVIAQSARVNAFVTVDAGLKEPTRIGERTFLMAHCHVGHDSQIGDDCELAPGTVIGGHVRLANGVRCGIGVMVRPFISVGEGARLGAGAVVVKDVPAGEIWAGNPAAPLEPAPCVGQECVNTSEHLPGPDCVPLHPLPSLHTAREGFPLG